MLKLTLILIQEKILKEALFTTLLIQTEFGVLRIQTEILKRLFLILKTRLLQARYQINKKQNFQNNFLLQRKQLKNFFIIIILIFWKDKSLLELFLIITLQEIKALLFNKAHFKDIKALDWNTVR